MTHSQTRVPVVLVDGAQARPTRSDHVATEEPMETRLLAGRSRETVSITMRTPGADFELAAGFLYGEGVLHSRDEVSRITYCVDREVDPEQRYNIVNVELRSNELPDLGGLERRSYTSSACGVCGKGSLEALRTCAEPLPLGGPFLDPELVYSLPAKLRAAQRLFDTTGGLHAAALFDSSGELLCLREDVGRHNALDKVVGWALLEGRLPLADGIVLVSGRTSFELAQKCVMARVPVLCSVSAPSSLAVSLAQDFGMTLIGFLRERRFNLYAGQERLLPAAAGNRA